MLTDNAENKIKEWVETSINNIHTLMDLFDDRGDWDVLNLASREASRMNCFWNVYHSTITPDTFSDELKKAVDDADGRVTTVMKKFPL